MRVILLLLCLVSVALKAQQMDYPIDTIEGKPYTKVEADVAEFEDLYMSQAYNGGINKMGLGIDEIVDATINFSRKNYADYFPEEDYPNDVKMVAVDFPPPFLICSK